MQKWLKSQGYAVELTQNPLTAWTSTRLGSLWPSNCLLAGYTYPQDAALYVCRGNAKPSAWMKCA